MPNWCSNDVVITGDITSIKEKLEDVNNKDDNFFNVLLDGIPGDLDSNRELLGTKWDVPIHQIFDNMEVSDEISLNFQTAWAPPINGLAEVAKKYNISIEIFYTEPGCDYSGKCFIDPDGEYSDDSKSFLEGLHEYDNEGFWYHIEDNMDFYIEEYETLDVIMDTYFKFLTDEDDINGIKEIFEETIIEK
jgi:hypothetical protein